LWGWLSVRAVTLVTASRLTLVSAWRRRADGKRDERDEDSANDDRDDDKDEAALAG
jgi:hypothetical protein